MPGKLRRYKEKVSSWLRNASRVPTSPSPLSSSPPSRPASPSQSANPASLYVPIDVQSLTYTMMATHSAVPSVGQLSPALDSFSHGLLKKTLEKLGERDRATIEEYISPSADDIELALRSAFMAAQEQRRVCETRRCTLRFGKRDISLRDEADKVVRLLDKCKQVGDIAVNVDPMHAGLPWAAIRLLLEVIRQRYAIISLPLDTIVLLNLLPGSHIRESSDGIAPCWFKNHTLHDQPHESLHRLPQSLSGRFVTVAR